MSKSLRIVFMGTPEFAVATLDALLKSRHTVVGVVTVPDKPANRGLKLQASAVKEFAVQHNIPVLQPEKLKNEEFIKALKALNPDLQVVVAFRMLPEIVWALPEYGTINLHASLLPQYRGAAPINWAIINGEKETGITTFFISHQIDTGDILQREKVPINDDDDAGIVHDKLMALGAELVVKTVDSIADNIIHPIKQEAETVLKAAPKIFRENCKINWNKSAEEVYNLIRGLSPYPGAWTEIANDKGDKTSLKIYKTAKSLATSLPMGTIAVNDKNQLLVGCSEGSIEIIELQAEGKKRMKAVDFLRGFPINQKNWKAIS
ncbi:MAG TPA: methionyl-tRNA formyltransferase [Bacteroidia bacterium]|jgi:methionyl-tRNA formyltransferase|nr:methionyl-tRNA formyltransferase [Bacteroidia bacterium]